MTTIERILSQMSKVSKPQRKFLLMLFSTISMLRGRMNFRNLGRYSIMNENSISRNFRKQFDFSMLNNLLISETIPETNRKMAAIDASYVPKSGKHSYGIDYSQVVLKKARKFHHLQLLIWTITPHTTFLLSKPPLVARLAKKKKIVLIFIFSKLNEIKSTCKIIASLILPPMAFTQKPILSTVLLV